MVRWIFIMRMSKAAQIFKIEAARSSLKVFSEILKPFIRCLNEFQENQYMVWYIFFSLHTSFIWPSDSFFIPVSSYPLFPIFKHYKTSIIHECARGCSPLTWYSNIATNLTNRPLAANKRDVNLRYLKNA